MLIRHDKLLRDLGEDTPSELELLTTTLYVYKQQKNDKKTVEGVIKIKGTKYTIPHIEQAITRLREQKYIS